MYNTYIQEPIFKQLEILKVHQINHSCRYSHIQTTSAHIASVFKDIIFAFV